MFYFAFISEIKHLLICLLTIYILWFILSFVLFSTEFAIFLVNSECTLKFRKTGLYHIHYKYLSWFLLYDVLTQIYWSFLMVSWFRIKIIKISTNTFSSEMIETSIYLYLGPIWNLVWSKEYGKYPLSLTYWLASHPQIIHFNPSFPHCFIMSSLSYTKLSITLGWTLWKCHFHRSKTRWILAVSYTDLHISVYF